MLLWMSAEMMDDVADAYRACRKEIEGKVNLLLVESNLLLGVEKWAFIAIIREVDSPDFVEVVKRGGKGKVLEFRLKIPYVDFRDGSGAQRVSLIFDALLRSAELMKDLKVLAEDVRRVKDILIRVRQDLVSG